MTVVGSLEFEATLDTSGIRSALGGLETSVGGTLQSLSGAATAAGATLSKSLSLPLAGAVAAMTKVFTDYSRVTQMTAAVTGASADELARLNKQALELGSRLPVTATQAAEAQLELAKAGLTLADTLAVTEHTARLAVAGQLNMKSAAEIVASAMAIFGIEAENAARVTDVLAQAANASLLDVKDFGIALSYAGPVAASLGISLESLSASLAALSNAGYDAEKAGTAVRGIISDLINPTKAAKERLDALGITVTDSSGAFVGLAAIVDQFKAVGATAADVFAIFGDRAGPAFLALMNTGGDALRALEQDFIQSEGTAERFASQMAQGIPGSLDRLKASFERLSVAFGQSKAMDILIRMIDGLALGITKLSGLFDRLGPRWTGVIAVVGAAVVAIGPLLLIVGQLAGMFALLASPIGLVVLAIVAVVVIIAVLIEFWPEISAFFDNVRNKVLGFYDAITGTFNAVMDFIKRWWPEMLGIVLLFFTGPGGLVYLFATNGFGIRDRVIEAFTAVRDFITGTMNNVVAFIARVLSDIVGFFSEFPRRVVNALGDLSGVLWNAGAQLVGGLLGAVQDGLKKLRSMLDNIPGAGKVLGALDLGINVPATVPAPAVSAVNITVNGSIYGDIGFRERMAELAAENAFLRGGR